MELILGLIFIGVVWILCKLPEWKFDNSLPPEGYQTDYTAMNRDLASGKSKTEVINKSNRGEYYIKKK